MWPLVTILPREHAVRLEQTVVKKETVHSTMFFTFNVTYWLMTIKIFPQFNFFSHSYNKHVVFLMSGESNTM